MRRIQYNLAYLAAIADRSHKPSSQIPPHPAVISAPSLTPLPKSASSPTSPNGAVKLSTDGAADNDGEDRAETLKKQYKRLQELFPGVDPKKEPQVQPTGAAQKQQQQQPGGPSAPQKAQMAAQMHQQLAQMSQAQKMEFMQRKGMQMPQQPNAQQQQQLNRMRQQQQQMQQQQPGWRPGQPGGPQQGQQRMGPGMQQGMGPQQGGMDMNAMGMGGSPGMQPGQGQ